MNILSPSLGINNAAPNTNAILDIVSTTKGVLIPRMTTAQKNLIPTPLMGLEVFDTTLAAPCWYNGSAWVTVGANTMWSILGNTGTSSTTNYIGTTDAVGLSFRTSAAERINIGTTGLVGIGTNAQTATLDVNGSARIRTLSAAPITDTAVMSDASGNLHQGLVIGSGIFTPTISFTGITSVGSLTARYIKIGTIVTVTIGGYSMAFPASTYCTITMTTPFPTVAPLNILGGSSAGGNGSTVAGFIQGINSTTVQLYFTTATSTTNGYVGGTYSFTSA